MSLGAMTESASISDGSWTATWIAVPGSLAPIRAALVHYAHGLGASRRTRDALALAVTEAAANAIVHGYPDGPGDIAIEAWLVEPRVVRVIVRDDGCGMQSDHASSGAGLGLPLIEQLAEDVANNSTPGAGTEISMDFALAS